MTREEIKKVITEKCIKPFKNAKTPWDLDVIVDALLAGSRSHKVELELALAQGILECHFGCNPAAVRSRKTRNIYNVGNVDSGANKFFRTYEAGIDRYFRLMAREYCWRAEGDTVTVEMMVRHNFKRPRGGRYATSPSYTANIEKIVAGIKAMFNTETQRRGDTEEEKPNDKSLAKPAAGKKGKK